MGAVRAGADGEDFALAAVAGRAGTDGDGRGVAGAVVVGGAVVGGALGLTAGDVGGVLAGAVVRLAGVRVGVAAGRGDARSVGAGRGTGISGLPGGPPMIGPAGGELGGCGLAPPLVAGAVASSASTGNGRCVGATGPTARLTSTRVVKTSPAPPRL
ncbi:hypothetical protein [Luedemannella helvata]|uniref:hypothetical protein n=1 Tax=Luedemannella helvata TaxID=349315 RepID=UPI0031E123C0